MKSISPFSSTSINPSHIRPPQYVFTKSVKLRVSSLSCLQRNLKYKPNIIKFSNAWPLYEANYTRHHRLVRWETGDDNLNLTVANSDTKVEEKVKDYTRLFHHCLKLLLLGSISIFSCDSAVTFKCSFNPVCSLCSWAAPLTQEYGEL